VKKEVLADRQYPRQFFGSFLPGNIGEITMGFWAWKIRPRKGPLPSFTYALSSVMSAFGL
jgi:hypothetical protein